MAASLQTCSFVKIVQKYITGYFILFYIITVTYLGRQLPYGDRMKVHSIGPMWPY